MTKRGWKICGATSALLAAVLLAAVAMQAGCASWYGPTVEVEGETYRALKKIEEDLLVEVARRYLKKNTPKVVSVRECDIALRTEPELKIVYTGDRRGEAYVTWEMPKRWLTVLFIGNFLERDMYCILQEKERLAGMIDCRSKSDPSRYVTPVFPQNAGEQPAGGDAKERSVPVER